MAEKRFYKKKSTIEKFMLYDECREDAYFITCDEHTIDCLVDLLNTLHEENNAFKNIIQHFIVKEFKITKEDIIHGKGGDATDFSSVIDEFFNNEVNISEIQIELKGEKNND